MIERVQRQVWWLYPACSRRIAYALRPLIAAGWAAPQLAAELATWGVPPHLKDPAAYFRHELHRPQQHNELSHTELPAHDVPIDDGSRYEAMLRKRVRQGATALRRYTEQTRDALRDELAHRRRSRLEQPGRPVYRRVLREPEGDFLASLPGDTWTDAGTPREIYAARARGASAGRGRAMPPVREDIQHHLHDHAEAARACDLLREAWHDLPDTQDAADRAGRNGVRLLPALGLGMSGRAVQQVLLPRDDLPGFARQGPAAVTRRFAPRGGGAGTRCAGRRSGTA
ncbi:hypothetical protein [Streptomyces sp. NPDC055056]